MALLNKIGQVLTTDLTKDFKFPKKSKAVEHLEFTFVEKLKKCRGTYQLGKRVHFSQAYLTELIQEAVHSCPSAYNSQSARIIVLFADSHHQFWNIVKDVQRQHRSTRGLESSWINVQMPMARFYSMKISVPFSNYRRRFHLVLMIFHCGQSRLPAWCSLLRGLRWQMLV